MVLFGRIVNKIAFFFYLCSVEASLHGINVKFSLISGKKSYFE